MFKPALKTHATRINPSVNPQLDLFPSLSDLFCPLSLLANA